MYTIYFGKTCTGKSTYLLSIDKKFVNFDKLIWSFFSISESVNYKNAFKEAILAKDISKYKQLMNELNSKTDWYRVFEVAGGISNIFEMPALGQWYRMIPKDLMDQCTLVKVECDPEVRKKRMESRNYSKMAESLEYFYKNPPRWDKTITI